MIVHNSWTRHCSLNNDFKFTERADRVSKKAAVDTENVPYTLPVLPDIIDEIGCFCLFLWWCQFTEMNAVKYPGAAHNHHSFSAPLSERKQLMTYPALHHRSHTKGLTKRGESALRPVFLLSLHQHKRALLMKTWTERNGLKWLERKGEIWTE